MAALVLGVIEGIHSAGDGVMVSEVAQKLEAEYGLMGSFWEINQDAIRKMLMDEFMRCIRTDEDFTGKRTMEKVKTMFRIFLDTEQHGINTKAASMGIRHRNQQVESGEPRLSFIDTGDYRGSFVAWIEE